MRCAILIACLATTLAAVAQRELTLHDLVLPNEPGKMSFDAPGFTIIEASVKPNGNELGLRGRDAKGQLEFLAFLFTAPKDAPTTPEKCRDSELAQVKAAKIQPQNIRLSDASDQISLMSYEANGAIGQSKPQRNAYTLAASGVTCAEIRFYNLTDDAPDDGELQRLASTLRYDPSFQPTWAEVFAYAQLLYNHHAYAGAAPLFEKALTMLPTDVAKHQIAERLITDQAGMSYGQSGQTTKAIAIFEAAKARDPEYPMYYYSLACGQAESGNLADAKVNLKAAFSRKQNMLPGEELPNPMRDDSFLAHKNSKDFWTFLQTLQ